MTQADNMRHRLYELEASLYEARMDAAEAKALALLSGDDQDFSKIHGHFDRTRQKIDSARAILTAKGLTL